MVDPSTKLGDFVIIVGFPRAMSEEVERDSVTIDVSKIVHKHRL
jgi:hypothetical protein